MGEYLSPGVYVENVPSTSVPIESVSASTGGFIGVSPRGVVGVPTFISSWTAFLANFGGSIDSPFIANSDLAYAVYGFFQNGGQRCYITRVASATVATASALITGVDGAVISAYDAGTWGNKLKIKVTANVDTITLFDMVVKLNDVVVETFVGLSNDTTNANYFVDVINANTNKLIKVVTGKLFVTEVEVSLIGGLDGVSDLTDTHYTDALAKFDKVSEVTLIAIPGQTSNIMTLALLAYCSNRGDCFAILDAPKSADIETVKTLRKTISGKGALYFPWIRVSDPLSKVGKLRDCPTCGHIMGVYARTIADRGVHKNPAGVECVVRGAIEVITTLTKGECDILNPLCINAIMPRPNVGITVWGTRTLDVDATFKYVADVLLNIVIRKSIYNGTQAFVFEPHDSTLWTRVTVTIQDYLDSLWREGALFGDVSAQAYRVKCDEELNPQNIRNQGKLICQVGYASKKPAEFVIFRVSHEIPSN